MFLSLDHWGLYGFAPQMSNFRKMLMQVLSV